MNHPNTIHPGIYFQDALDRRGLSIPELANLGGMNGVSTLYSYARGESHITTKKLIEIIATINYLCPEQMIDCKELIPY